MTVVCGTAYVGRTGGARVLTARHRHEQPIDFALACYSAHELPDLRRLLTEIHGHLRPGDKFLVVEPIGHVTAENFKWMLSLAQEIGFRLQEPT